MAALRAAEEERKTLAAQNGAAPMIDPPGYQPVGIAPPLVKEPEPDDVLAIAPPEKLADLVRLALERAHDILSIRLDPLHTDFIKLVSLQQSTLASVLATQARTDPGRLRGQQTDKLGELLERIKATAR